MAVASRGRIRYSAPMAHFDVLQFSSRLALQFVPFLFALCVHEFAHGLVAKWRGDRTAEQAGRLTLNPLAHADPIGTFLLPILAVAFPSPIFFGWAKPVPVNSNNLKSPRTDLFWIALAGPASNLLMAVIAGFIFGLMVKFVPADGATLAAGKILNHFILINLFLAVFNLIPLHPLDGGKVLARFLPAKTNYWLEQNEHVSSYILLGLMISGVLGILAIPVMALHSLLVGWAL
jgi:Zn-dependent protease